MLLLLLLLLLLSLAKCFSAIFGWPIHTAVRSACWTLSAIPSLQFIYGDRRKWFHSSNSFHKMARFIVLGSILFWWQLKWWWEQLKRPMNFVRAHTTDTWALIFLNVKKRPWNFQNHIISTIRLHNTKPFYDADGRWYRLSNTFSLTVNHGWCSWHFLFVTCLLAQAVNRIHWVCTLFAQDDIRIDNGKNCGEVKNDGW